MKSFLASHSVVELPPKSSFSVGEGRNRGFTSAGVELPCAELETDGRNDECSSGGPSDTAPPMCGVVLVVAMVTLVPVS